MAVRNLRIPTRIGDTIEDVSGVRYISWDGTNWNLYRINEDNGIEGGTTTGSTPEMDASERKEIENALLSFGGASRFIRRESSGALVKSIANASLTVGGMGVTTYTIVIDTTARTKTIYVGDNVTSGDAFSVVSY